MVCIPPSGDSPEILTGSAPSIRIGLWLAAVIAVVVGIRFSTFNPIFCSTASPARVDWHPVSAIAGTCVVSVGLVNLGLCPS